MEHGVNDLIITEWAQIVEISKSGDFDSNNPVAKNLSRTE